MNKPILLFSSVVVAAVFAQPNRCGLNEVFDSCGSACEPTCRNPNPQVCTLQCVAGCRCNTGFFRNDRGVCVRNCSSPPPPPPPQPQPPAPSLTCANVRCPQGTVCRLVVVQCIRAPCPPRPQCIPVIQTPPRCPRNESWRGCSSRCEPSCRNMNPVCELSCGPGMCQCNIGFFRSQSRGCVRRSQCPRS